MGKLQKSKQIAARRQQRLMLQKRRKLIEMGIEEDLRQQQDTERFQTSGSGPAVATTATVAHTAPITAATSSSTPDAVCLPSESTSSRSRKRKPDQTFKYVQPEESVTRPAKMEVSEEDDVAEVARKTVDAEKEDKEVEEKKLKDPYYFLSEADKTLLQTNVVEFLKRFAPKYYIPVYKTWTIPRTSQ